MSLNPISISTSPLTGPLTPTFDDPIGVLKACHGRIEQRIEILERACEVFQGKDWNKKKEALNALSPVVAYFTTGGAKHTEDEEISLFPRLRLHLAEGDEALEVMRTLESQHREAETDVEQLEQIVARLMSSSGEISLEETEILETVTVTMGLHYRPHIRVEDDSIFPRAMEILKEEELIVIGREMADRRGVKASF